MENNMEGEVTMLIPPMQSLSLRPTSSEKIKMKDDDASSRGETEWEEQRKTMFPVKDESELLLRKVRSVLNKISSVNYNRLRSRWLNLIPTDEGQLTQIIRLVVMKATDEPIFMEMYAQLFGYALLNSSADDAERLRRMLLLHIHRCLQRLATDLELAKSARSVERETFARQKKIQLYRFIAVLFLENVCTPKFVMERVSDLVGQASLDWADVDEPLECLCVFLTFAGFKLEEVKRTWLNTILLKINLREAANCPSLSKRIQFMVQDLLEMQSKDWMPHNKWWTPSATPVESRARYSSAP